jgi:long-chain acyl-CoA synthetase
VLDEANAISAWFMDKGIQKQDMCALLIENCPEYITYDQGLMQIGLVNVSIYPTLSESEIEYIINDSGSKALLVGTPFLLKKVLKLRKNCPTLQYIIAAFEPAKPEEGVISYSQFIKEGTALYPGLKDKIEAQLLTVKRSDLSCLLYTSGTTGKPKGAMLTHDNFLSDLEMALELIDIVNKDYVFLSFLPMCHVLW